MSNYVTIEDNLFETSEGATGSIEPIDESVNLTPFMDEVEDECWTLFCKYASAAGIEFDEDSEIDFRIAKEISEHIIQTIETAFDMKYPI